MLLLLIQPTSPVLKNRSETIRRYLALGMTVPTYGPRSPRANKLDPNRQYLKERIKAYPGLSARRLLREIQQLG